ncbi:holin [Streptomyces uncialis]|uniref:holin n=1 Tax=Streptomyces uncialis TaxID=1048205 RepID=UPI00386B631B|nr:holin [Streptomyces uncialis]
MMTRAFWRATAERTIRTGAQATAAAVGTDALGILDVDWGEAFSVGGLAAVLTVLTAIAASGGTEGPGVTETVARPAAHRLPRP